MYAVSNHSLRPPHPLWCDITQDAHAAILFYDWFGHCLNYGATGHSTRNCPEKFFNRSNALNSAVGTPPEGDQICWREWQKRIPSYRINQTRNRDKPQNNHRNGRRNRAPLDPLALIATRTCLTSSHHCPQRRFPVTRHPLSGAAFPLFQHRLPPTHLMALGPHLPPLRLRCVRGPLSRGQP